MGDRTPIEVVIYSCPPERVNTVPDALDRATSAPHQCAIRASDPSSRLLPVPITARASTWRWTHR